jgi:hypothetical protein
LPASGLLLHRGLGPRAVGADVDNRVDERASERAVTPQDDVADGALGRCSEDARRLPDTESRSKGSAAGETRRRREQTSNPNQLLLLCGQDGAPVAHTVDVDDS